MKILIPIVGFGRTGGYRVLSELANAWVRQGHIVDFLSPSSSELPYFPTTANIRWVDRDGRVQDNVTLKSSPNGYSNLKALFNGISKIGYEYNVILANHSFTAWPVALISCGRAIKAYYVQAYEPAYLISKLSFKNLILTIISAFSYHLPLRRIVNSPIYFKFRNLRADVCVPPGIDLNIFSPKQKPGGLQNEGAIILGCIGRSEPYKGTEFILRAFEILAARDKRFKLRVAYGNLPEGWQHERCEVVVPANDHELADFYRSVDILIAAGTIQHGAAHYPVLEGLATGAIVVTTGYMGATVDTAWLVKNKDSESIVETVCQLLKDPFECERKARNGVTVADEYSWTNLAARMLQFIMK